MICKYSISQLGEELMVNHQNVRDLRKFIMYNKDLLSSEQMAYLKYELDNQDATKRMPAEFVIIEGTTAPLCTHTTVQGYGFTVDRNMNVVKVSTIQKFAKDYSIPASTFPRTLSWADYLNTEEFKNILLKYS